MDLNGIVDKALSRRSFLTGLGTAAAATALAGCGDDTPGPVPTGTDEQNDVAILNFALNLEYLEAEFYLRAATGSGLLITDIGLGASALGTSAGAVTGGLKVPGLSTVQQRIVNEFAYDEQQHVRALRAALGANAIARPAIDLTAGFAASVAAANTATIASGVVVNTIPTTFSPFTDFDSFLVGGFLFEDVGVTAYNGAAPLLSAAGSMAGLLNTAAGLLSTEGYHAGILRTLLTGNAITLGATAYPFAGYANRISALRGALGGGNETPLTGFTAAPTPVATATGSTIVPANSSSLAYGRTTSQVMHIVYGTGGGAGVAKGGFFPNGLNGTLTATTA